MGNACGGHIDPTTQVWGMHDMASLTPTAIINFEHDILQFRDIETVELHMPWHFRKGGRINADDSDLEYDSEDEDYRQSLNRKDGVLVRKLRAQKITRATTTKEEEWAREEQAATNKESRITYSQRVRRYFNSLPLVHYFAFTRTCVAMLFWGPFMFGTLGMLFELGYFGFVGGGPRRNYKLPPISNQVLFVRPVYTQYGPLYVTDLRTTGVICWVVEHECVLVIIDTLSYF